MDPASGVRRRGCVLLTRFAVALAFPSILLSAEPAELIPPDSPVAPQLRTAEEAVQKIIAIPAGQRTFDNSVAAMDDLYARLELDTNMLTFMAHVSTDPAQRERGERAERDIANWETDVGKRPELYAAIRAFADSHPKLGGEQGRLLEHTLRDLRRAGAALPAGQRSRLTQVERQLTDLQIEFARNIREDETRVPLTARELAGVPGDVLKTLTRSGDIYLLGMAYPELLPVMRYCENQTTRHKAWLANDRRGGQRNIRILEEVLALRAEQARLLGYPNAAQFEAEIRMAKSTANVLAFYDKLRPLVREKAKLDLEEYTAAKRKHTGDPRAVLQRWDVGFYGNLLRKEKYSVDSQQVQEYFPLQAVLDGLFGITQKLYGLEYREITASAKAAGRSIWHEDVRLYEVLDKQTGPVIGEFYIDLHPRPGKYTHAAQWGLAQHKVWPDGTITRPLAALVCNFTKPTPDKPSLLTHGEVETLFHEFGHCLHTLLSQARFWRFAGTSVERDFVEAPSQMFEEWVWDADVLRGFAHHYKTGEPFPRSLLEGLIAARNVGSGLSEERQIYYGLYDMRCHLAPDGKVDTTKLARELLDPSGERVELFDPVPETYFQAGFGHLMGYNAGYYGYQWSLVYAIDMFDRFKRLGLLSPEAGAYYRQKVLARGGTMDGMDIVRDYLGREPDMGPYLRHLGLDVKEAK